MFQYIKDRLRYGSREQSRGYFVQWILENDMRLMTARNETKTDGKNKNNISSLTTYWPELINYKQRGL